MGFTIVWPEGVIFGSIMTYHVQILLLVRQPLFDRAALLLTQTSWVLPPLSVGKMTLRLYGALNYSHGLSKGPSFGTGREYVSDRDGGFKQPLGRCKLLTRWAFEYFDQTGIRTNGCENFWSLLKRSIRGTYVSVEPFHLFRYLDEQAYRFNERHGTDGDRFSRALRRVVGKRLQYRELTGQP